MKMLPTRSERIPVMSYSRAWGAIVSFSLLIACSHGITDSVPIDPDLSGACDEYAGLIGECFGTPKLAETTRKSLTAKGRSPEQAESIEKQCKANALALRSSCK